MGDKAIHTYMTFWFLSLYNSKVLLSLIDGLCMRREKNELVDEELWAFEFNDVSVFLYHVLIIIIIS